MAIWVSPPAAERMVTPDEVLRVASGKLSGDADTTEESAT
jgi:hypothetical protein